MLALKLSLGDSAETHLMCHAPATLFIRTLYVVAIDVDIRDLQVRTKVDGFLEFVILEIVDPLSTS